MGVAGFPRSACGADLSCLGRPMLRLLRTRTRRLPIWRQLPTPTSPTRRSLTRSRSKRVVRRQSRRTTTCSFPTRKRKMIKTISTCRELCLCTSAASPRRTLTVSPCSTTSQTVTDAETTPLEVFLATSMLATDVDTQDAKGDTKLEVSTPVDLESPRHRG